MSDILKKISQSELHFPQVCTCVYIEVILPDGKTVTVTKPSVCSPSIWWDSDEVARDILRICFHFVKERTQRTTQRNKGDRWLELQYSTADKQIIWNNNFECHHALLHWPQGIFQVISPTELIYRGQMEGRYILAPIYKYYNWVKMSLRGFRFLLGFFKRNLRLTHSVWWLENGSVKVPNGSQMTNPNDFGDCLGRPHWHVQ